LFLLLELIFHAFVTIVLVLFHRRFFLWLFLVLLGHFRIFYGFALLVRLYFALLRLFLFLFIFIFLFLIHFLC